MLERLELQNYRGFDDHVIPFRELTVLVGRNNAGKSTAVEALRLVGIVVRRFRTTGTRFEEIPYWLDDLRAYRGVAPAVTDLDFHEDTFFHRYGGPPAVLTAHFGDGASVHVFVGPFGYVHGVARGSDGHAVGTPLQARALGLPDIRVQPQLGPLLRDERVLASATVMRNLAVSPSAHFRNQISLFPEDFAPFKALAEEMWPQLQIIELGRAQDERGETLNLLVRDQDFAADAGLMGHGLQLWLQTVWFLSRCPSNACVVLDEPDVYMHPDLQHRLVARIERTYEQVIVATHSVEIITAADPQALIVIDRGRSQSEVITSLPAAQRVIETLGTVNNLQVMRLFRTDRFLMIEGDDIRLLAELQTAALSGQAVAPIRSIPAYETGGWGGWRIVLASDLPRKNGEGDPITTYCIFDSDYHTQREIEERYEEAARKRVNLHVWRRKELENYFLVSNAIARAISTRRRKRKRAEVSALLVEQKLLEIADSLRTTTIETIAHELDQRDRRLGLRGSLAAARRFVDERWDDSDGPLGVVSGKTVLHDLSRWAQSEYGASLSPVTIARAMEPTEVPLEACAVIDAIEKRERFRTDLR